MRTFYLNCRYFKFTLLKASGFLREDEAFYMKLKRILNIIAAAVFTAAMAVTTAFASTDNPLTGDEQGRYIGVVVAVAAVALIVIVVILIISSRKGKK